MAEAISVDAVIPGDADKTIRFSTGKLAGQADGAVTVQIGDTVMLVGRRRRLLDYVKKTDVERYRSIIAKLGLRR